MGRSGEPGCFRTLQGAHTRQGLPHSRTLNRSSQGRGPSLLRVTHGLRGKAPSLGDRQSPRPMWVHLRCPSQLLPRAGPELPSQQIFIECLLGASPAPSPLPSHCQFQADPRSPTLCPNPGLSWGPTKGTPPPPGWFE